MMKLKTIAALLAILVATSCTSGCNILSSRVDLPFQALDLGIGNYAGTSVGFYILTDSSSPLPSWLSTKPPWLDSVDFSTDFVVLVRVQPPQDAFLITDVRQIEKMVFIRAQFVIDIPGSGLPGSGSPGETIRVQRKNLRQFGDITFKLLDDYGVVIATTNTFIEPVSVSTGEPCSG